MKYLGPIEESNIEQEKPPVFLGTLEERPSLSDTGLIENDRIKKSQVLSATLQIPFSAAYDNEQGLSKIFQENDPSWFQTASNSLKRGVGNFYTTFGRAMELAGLEKISPLLYEIQPGVLAGKAITKLAGEKIPETYPSDFVSFGKMLQYKYAHPFKPEEFTFDKVLDPDWWATTPVESIPFTISLIPAAIVAAYGGAAAGGGLGLGGFGKIFFSSF